MTAKLDTLLARIDDASAAERASTRPCPDTLAWLQRARVYATTHPASRGDIARTLDVLEA